jgi:pimeloyl-ACP methyl ester carboxylesterase
MQQHRVETLDGRLLAGASYGPEQGKPVLFVAGAATGKSMTFGDDHLHEVGVKLLTMDRPGIGDSTPDPDRTLQSTAADYHAFARAVLGDVPLSVAANSQGAVFSLALAVDGRVERLVLVSPADEVAHPDIHAMLPAEATTLSDIAQKEPAKAATMLQGFSARAMEDMVINGAGAADRAFYLSEPFLAKYRRSLDEGFSNDGDGYVRDTLLAMRSWDLNLDAIRCSVEILFGEQDRGHSPDHGETLTRRIPGATRRVFSDAGGALLWTHARTILATTAP